MKKSFKKLLILALSVMMLASLTLGIGITAMAATPADVEMTFSDTADFTKSTQMIENKTVDTFGCVGWGGMVKVLTLTQNYDAQAIFDSGEGALSFDLYIGDETTLKNQQEASYWNLDVCSDLSYNDTNKYSFNLVSGVNVFAQCKIGWNRIVLPLSTANEKNSINWATVRTMRINMSTGIGNVLTFANFKFTTTGVGDKHALKVGVNELAPVSLTASKFTDAAGNVYAPKKFVKSFPYFNGTAVEQKSCYFMKDMGGYVGILHMDPVADASAYAESNTLKNESAAISFYMFFKTENCLAEYKNIPHFNIDICSGAPNGDGTYSYSDSYKWSVSAMKAIEQCRVGWNKVIIPLSTAPEKHGAMDWANIRFIRLNVGGAVATRVGTGDFQICTTEYTDVTVLDEERNIFPTLAKKQMSGTDTFNLVDFARDGEVVTTYIKPHTSPWWTLLSYKTPIDLSHYTAEEKAFDKDIASLNTPAPIEEYAALELSVYFPDEENLNHYKSCSGINIDLSSGADNGDGTYSYSDNHKYSFNFAKLFEKCSVGWNRLIIPFSTHDVEAGNANMDWANLRFVRINAHGDPGGKHPVTGKGFRIGFADIGVCFSTLTEMTVEGWVEPEEEEEIIKNEKVYCDGTETGFHVLGFDTAFGDGRVVSDACYFKEGEGALRFVGQGTGSSGTKLAKPVNLSMYDKLTMWLYVDNAANFLAMADGQIELTSSGTRNDGAEYSWALKSLNLKDGWNFIELDLASAKAGEPDITKIDYFNIYFVGVPAVGTVILDDLHAHVSEGVVLESFDNGFLGQVQTIEGKVGNATNMSGQGWVARKKYATPVNIADCDTLALWVRCDDETTCTSIAGTEIEISSSGQADIDELAFYLPSNLKVGWNYVTWKISDGRPSGTIDLTAVNFVGVVKVGLPMVTCFFDDFRAIDTKRVPEVVEPIEKQVIINADKVLSGVFNGMTIDDVEYKEGFAALSTTIKDGSTKLKASFEPVKTGLSLSGEHELGYAFWFYVEDVTKLTDLYVELGSYDGQTFELEWDIDLATIQSGWNWITLKASDAKRPNGVLDLNNLIRTRVVIEGAPTVVKFDCFVVVDSTLEGAFNPIEDKIELNPIDSVIIDNCESEWGYSDRAAEITEEQKMEGYASVVVNSGELATKVVNVGKTDLLYNPYRSNNEIGVSFWMYLYDASKITSAKLVLLNDIGGANSATWTITEGFVDGWNWVALGVEAGVFTTAFDADNIKYVQFGVEATESVDALVDRVSVINYAVEANRAQPAYEGIERNRVEDKVIIDCNAVGGFIFTGNRVDKDDFRYGTGSVYTSGYGYALSALDLSIGKTDLIKNTFVMALWVWIEDVTLFDVDSFNTQIEIGSTNNYDEFELYWDDWTENLTNGWNWVVLDGRNAKISGAAPDFDNLCRFRLYINGVDNSTLKIDRVTISNIYDEGIFSAPDWENEVINKDSAFSGANGYIAENSPYFDLNFDNMAEDYVAPAVQEIMGCYAGSITQLPVCLIFVAAAAAFIVKKRR